ncbi:MAG: AAA family ATPase [Acetobacterium sp.]|nr:AAA family ATPase [Acetobacterium sp.]MBP8866291.1 AAA family ATPase [Acetobacterium sp.]
MTKQLIPGKMTYVFLDEVQNVPQFEKAVDSLFNRTTEQLLFG